MDNRRYLTVDSCFYECDCVRSERLRESGICARQIIQSTRHKVAQILLKTFLTNETKQSFLHKLHRLIERGIADDVVETTIKKFIQLFVNKALDGLGRFLAL